MEFNRDVNTRYPNVIQVSGRGPTRKYNCHSYAWYDQSASNLWWIDSCQDFISDTATYYRASGASVREIVVYKTLANTTPYEHSGIVYQVSGSTVMVRSKWGPMGLYEHYI